MRLVKHGFIKKVKHCLLVRQSNKGKNEAMLDQETQKQMNDQERQQMAARIKEKMQQKGISNTALAETAGVSLQAVGQWLKSGKISRERLWKIAQYLDNTVDYLLTGIKSANHGIADAISSYLPIEPYDDGDPLGDAVEIPLLNVEAAAGAGAFNGNEYTRKKLRFRRDWLKKIGLDPAAACVIYAIGDSMAPSIMNGDHLLVNTADQRVVDSRVYAIRTYDGEIKVKRLYRRSDGGLTLVSDNPSFIDEALPSSAQLEIIGRVVWRCGEM